MYKKIFLFLCFFIPRLLFSQSQAVVLEISGSVQYQPFPASTWEPVTAGLKISEKNFLRLNSPESKATLSLPDGSQLRLIGLGSIYIDYISKIRNNTRQNKILLIAGRWYYQGNPKMPSRIIVNTDITTSIIENGGGGGYFYNGTNELVVKTGRGLSSYRQKDALAIVVNENQFISFNIYNGFDYPKLATPEIFAEYLVFDAEKSLKSAPQKMLRLDINKHLGQSKNFIITDRARLAESLSPRLQKAFTARNIRMHQMKILEDLSYKTNTKIVKIDLGSVSFTPETKQKKKVTLTPIRTASKQGLNLDGFSLSTNDVTKQKKDQFVPNKGSAVKIPNRKRVSVKPIRKKSTTQDSENKRASESSEVDIDKILASLAEKAAEEKKANRKKRTQSRRPKARVITENIEETQEEIPEEVYEEIPEEVYEEIPEEEYIDDIYYEEEYETPITIQNTRDPFQANDAFYQERDPNDPNYRYDSFNINSADDLLNSEFSKVLFGI